MFIPGFISVLIVIVVSILTHRMNQLGLDEKEFFSLAISAWASAGALISATFVVYGYLLNVRAFAEANKPKLLVFVENAQVTLIPIGQNVHQTRICYRNIGGVEAENFSLFAQLVGSNETLEIPRLFNEAIDLQIGDSRVRDFPTERYLIDNGIPLAVVQNLEKYKLRVGYSVRSLGKSVKRSYDYSWESSTQSWNIV
ncbi:hypothetical protein [Marinomonas foliarum]|uniref:Uncharacterized protein n=1 Tax=Marinomonas foliarum TaxID=491950 RepID=A0ABX7IQT6_9GAMM|nr:hypothetical protein [Marinomonas foliarum]QRV24705.1 hypothetical protein JSY38_03990 [Marinomonas foliarum]